jgi:hypothetical protein
LDIPVRDDSVPDGSAPDPRRIPQQPRPRALTLLAAVLLLEALGMVVVTVLLALEIATDAPVSAKAAGIGSAIALAVCSALAAVLLGAVARSTLRGAKWIRPAAFVWQILQVFVGLSAFTGAGSQPGLGLLLIVPAAVALVLLFTKSVLAATRREP